ncbi:MAG: DUF455 family protein [Myxococcota bacterium]
MTTPTLRDFCRGILENGDLETKLAPPPPACRDAQPGPALDVTEPARAPEIALTAKAGKLPRPSALREASARASCLARFAHHELMAVELFAWALLRWPELPAELRAAWRGILEDEQRHCQLYLERLSAHGGQLADHPRSDYFWRHAATIAAAPAGPAAFLSAMGLTLEQANLDFSGLYAEAFREAGDTESAEVCERVHADEIRHVRVSAVWLQRLAENDDDWQAYTSTVPFPFGANRAKGRRFDAESRRLAGLSETFIEGVRAASSQTR